MNHSKKLQFKEGLKSIAKEIKAAKISYRSAMRTNGDFWGNQVKCAQLRTEFRHKHLAYCMLRGTPREKVESNPSTGNPVNERMLLEYLSYFQGLLDGKTDEEAHELSQKAVWNCVANDCSAKAVVKAQNKILPPVGVLTKIRNALKSLFA